MDKLNKDYINNLPQPFVCALTGEQGHRWPVYDIDVQTGLVRIDVCGLLQIVHIAEIKSFKADDGSLHDPDTFYSEAHYENKT